MLTNENDKLLGIFEYGNKKALLEKTREGYLVTLSNIDPEPFSLLHPDIIVARRCFEHASRRAMSTMTFAELTIL